MSATFFNRKKKLGERLMQGRTNRKRTLRKEKKNLPRWVINKEIIKNLTRDWSNQRKSCSGWTNWKNNTQKNKDVNCRVTTLALAYAMAVKLGYNVPSTEVKKGTYLKKYMLHSKRLAPIGAARDRRRERNNRVNALSHVHTNRVSLYFLNLPANWADKTVRIFCIAPETITA